MATQVQWRGGSTAEHSTFTGAAREVTVDTQKKTLVVHDGSTAGGEPLLREDQNNLPTSVTNGISVPSANTVALSTNGTGRLFVDNGGVGINSAPASNSLTPLILKASAGTPLHFYADNSYWGLFDGGGTTGGYAPSNGYAGHNGNNYLNLFTAGTERLRITSDGKLGLGTSSPSVLLHVKGTADTQTVLRLEPSTSTTIYSQVRGVNGDIAIDADPGNAESSSAIKFNVDGTQRAVIDSSGRVGIGTTSPASILHCASTGDNNIRVVANGATAQVGVDVGVPFVGTNNGPFNFYSNGQIRATLDSSGRFLVGTSSAPSAGSWAQYARLVINGNTIDPTGAGILNLAAGTPATSIASGNSIGVIPFSDNGGNEFGLIGCFADATAGSGDYPGRLVFSTTADGASSPTERMRINNAGAQYAYSTTDGITASVSAAAASSGAIFEGRNSATAVNTGTACFVVRYNGNVQNTNNSYTGTSDIKLKENIVDASSQWSDIKSLRVVNYNFKPETGAETFKQLGLIAQEVELVSPGLVTESPDRDEDGNDLGTVTKSVNYSVLYMKAVKALQEAMERIEVLEQRLTDAGIA